MTYSVGGQIQATDYNGFAASINALWGTGTLERGYGQSSTLSSVSNVNVVTATQWATLMSRIDSLSYHQTGLASGLTSPTTGNIISYITTLNGNITTVDTNRLSFAASGSASSQSFSTTNPWATQDIREVTITWANADAMRYWFNAGGTIIFTGKNSVLAGNTKSTDWDSLFTACADVRIRAQGSAKVGGTGTPSTHNLDLGFYDLTSSYQTILEQFSTTVSGGYNLNYANFAAKLNTDPGSSTIMTVRMTSTDAAADVADDYVMGTTTLDVEATPPSTTYLSNTWGAVTFGTAVVEGAAPPFSWRAGYTNTTTLTTYTFPTCDIGVGHSSRMVVVAVATTGSQNLNSMTVAGVSATVVADSANNSVLCDIWKCAVPSGASTGDIVCTFSGAITGCAIFVWVGYPSSQVHQSMVSGWDNDSSIAASPNVPYTNGGFGVSIMNITRTDNPSPTFTNVESQPFTENYDGAFDANWVYATSRLFTATSSTNDFTVDFSGSGNIGYAYAFWAP